jgi:hypothetical protein
MGFGDGLDFPNTSNGITGKGKPSCPGCSFRGNIHVMKPLPVFKYLVILFTYLLPAHSAFRFGWNAHFPDIVLVK